MDWAQAGSSLLGSTIATIGGLYTNAQNRKLQEKINKQQQANFDRQFNYQQYLNENQHQIETKDLAKAGINPIVGAGGQLNSFSGSANLDASGQQNPIDTTAFTQFAQLKHDEAERKKDRENAKEIAKIQGQTAEKVAEINAETSKTNTNTSTETQKYIAQMQQENQKEIEKAKNELQEKLARADREQKARLQTQAEEAEKKLQEAQREWEDSDDHRNALRLMRDAYNRLDEAHEMRQYLQQAKVVINGQKYTLDDAIKYYEMHETEFEQKTQASTWALDQIRQSFKTLLGAIIPFKDNKKKK